MGALAVERAARRVFSGDDHGVIWAWAAKEPVKEPLKESLRETEQASPLATPLATPRETPRETPRDMRELGADFSVEGRPLVHALLRGKTITSLALQPSRGVKTG